MKRILIFLIVLQFSLLTGCADAPLIGSWFEEDDNNDELIAALLLLSAANSGTNDSGARSCNGYPSSRRGESSTTISSSTYTTGYSQVSSNNQDAYVLKETDGNLDWCFYYDTSPDDSRGEALAADSTGLYVAFSCTGGNTTFRGTDGAFKTSYGRGGGPKVTYFARINPADGSIQAATFLIAVLTNGDTNSLSPIDTDPIAIGSGTVTLRANHAAHPQNAGYFGENGSDPECTIDGYNTDTNRRIDISLNQSDMSLSSANCL